MDFSIENILGKTLLKIERAGEKDNSEDAIIFHTSEGEVYKMYHSQDCCECVGIDDINGDLADLLNAPILQAEESCSYPSDEGSLPKEDYEDSYTWTFYKIATEKGFVTIKWYGSSNGYYSESVDFAKLINGTFERWS